MSPSPKSSGTVSPLSTAPSLDDQPVEHGLLSPGTATDHDDIYVEDDIPVPEATVYDRKGKGKARQRSLSRTPRIPFEDEHGPDVLDVMAKQAYLSPPLTSSDTFLLGVQNISRVLRRGLSSIDFDVDLDLQSDSEGSRSPSPAGRSSSSTTSEREEGEGEGGFQVGIGEVVGVGTAAASVLSLDDMNGSSSASALTEPESSRRATIGDTTLQDVSAVLPSVRFPSIFIQDMDISSLESSRTASPLLGPIVFDDVEHRRKGRVLKDSGLADDGTLVQRRPSVGAKTKRKRVRRWRRLKIQEKGLSRDFLLIIMLCFGMACAGILILRPSFMALFGYDSRWMYADFD